MIEISQHIRGRVVQQLYQLVTSRIIFFKFFAVLGLSLLVLLPTEAVPPDPSLYLIRGLKLAQGHSNEVIGFTATRPLLPVMLAVAFYFFGSSIQVAAIVSLLLAIVAVSIVFFFGEMVIGRWTGFVAAVLILSSPYFRMELPRVMSDTPRWLFLLLAFGLLVWSLDRTSRLTAVSAGLSAGLAQLMRPDTFLYLPMVLILLGVHDSYRTRRNLTNLGLFLLIASTVATITWVHLSLTQETISELNLKNRITDVLLVEEDNESFVASETIDPIEQLNRIAHTIVPTYSQTITAYTQSQIASALPTFFLLLVAWGYLLVRAVTGDKISRILWVGFFASLPILAIIANWEQPIRHLLFLFSLSYLALSKMLIDVLITLRRWSRAKQQPLIYYAPLVLAIVFGIMWLFRPQLNNLKSTPRLDDANRPIVWDTVDWINEHIPAGSRVAVTWQWIQGINFFTGGNLDIEVVPIMIVRPESLSRGQNLLFIREHRMGYGTLPADSLLTFLRTSQIDYLVITGNYETLSPLNLLDNIASIEGLTKVFQTGQGNEQIHIFKVNPRRIRFRQTPVTILSATSLAKLLFETEDISSVREISCADSPDKQWIVNLLNPQFKVVGWLEDKNWAYNCLGALAATSGAIDKAVLAFANVDSSQIQSGLPPTTDSNQLVYLLSGLWELTQGKQDIAVSLLHQALQANPQEVNGYLALGYAYTQNQQPELALDMYHQVLTLQPDNSIVHIKMAELYKQSGQIILAANSYQLALFQQPTAIQAANTLAATVGQYYWSRDRVLLGLELWRSTHNLLYQPVFKPNFSNKWFGDLPVLNAYDASSILRKSLFTRASSQELYLSQLSTATKGSKKLLAPKTHLRLGISLPNQSTSDDFSVTLDAGQHTVTLLDKSYPAPTTTAWQEYDIDLSPWAGQKVTLRFEKNNDQVQWVNPRLIQPAYYGFMQQFPNATINGDPANILPGWLPVENEIKDVLWQQPSARLVFPDVEIQPKTTLNFGLAALSPDSSEEVRFKIMIEDRAGEQVEIFNQAAPQTLWQEQAVDLDQFAGKTVDIQFVVTGDTATDGSQRWLGWGNPILISVAPEVQLPKPPKENCETTSATEICHHTIAISPTDLETVETILDTYLVWGFDYIDQTYVLAATEAYETAMKQSPDKEALVKLAEVYLKLNQPQPAIDAYERALAIRPEEVWPAYDLADTYLNYGQQLEDQQDFEAAFRAYHRAFELTPNVPEVLDAMVRAYRTFGKGYFDPGLIAEVVTVYKQQTVDLNPDNFQNYLTMGGVFQQVGRPDEAIHLYQQAAERWPDNVTVYQRLATLYQHQGNLAAAIAAMQQAIETNPDQVQLYAQLANFYSGNQLFYQKQALYEKAVENNPDAAWPRLELGRLYLEQAMSNAPN